MPPTTVSSIPTPLDVPTLHQTASGYLRVSDVAGRALVASGKVFISPQEQIDA